MSAFGTPTPAGWPVGPTRRKRGWLRVLIGLVMIFGGFAAIALGIVAVVGERDRIEDEAVARGVTGEPLSFTAAERGDYTVFLISGGSLGAPESVVSNTQCEVDAGGGLRTFSGAVQSLSFTIGNASSVGRFEAPAGEVALLCQTAGGSVAYFVTPGSPAFLRVIAVIIGGVLAILGGIGILIWGLVGKRVPA